MRSRHLVAWLTESACSNLEDGHAPWDANRHHDGDARACNVTPLPDGPPRASARTPSWQQQPQAPPSVYDKMRAAVS